MFGHSKCGGTVFLVAPRLLILKLVDDIAVEKKVFHFNRLGHFQLVFGQVDPTQIITDDLHVLILPYTILATHFGRIDILADVVEIRQPHGGLIGIHGPFVGFHFRLLRNGGTTQWQTDENGDDHVFHAMHPQMVSIGVAGGYNITYSSSDQPPLHMLRLMKSQKASFRMDSYEARDHGLRI